MTAGPIEWSDRLLLGHDLLDQQHKAFFVQALRLHVACKLGRGTEQVDAAVKFLRDYAMFHFAAEEAEMSEAGYAGLDEHRAEHQRFLRELAGLIDYYKQSGADPDVAAELARMGCEWFSNHITGFDAAFVETVRGREGD